MMVFKDWWLTPQRAAIHLPTATAVVADLHLGYDLARRRRGEAVPSVGLDDTIAVLGPLLFTGEVRRLVVAGDLVEDESGEHCVQEFLKWLNREGVELAGIVPGNHDRGLGKRSVSLPMFPEGFCLDGWRVLHGHGRLPRGKLVLGHFHPCLRWPGGPAAPCYLWKTGRMVLPAFSPDAAGVNVWRDRRWRSYRCGALAGDEVLDFGLVGLLPQRLAQSSARKKRKETP